MYILQGTFFFLEKKNSLNTIIPSNYFVYSYLYSLQNVQKSWNKIVYQLLHSQGSQSASNLLVEEVVGCIPPSSLYTDYFNIVTFLAKNLNAKQEKI